MTALRYIVRWVTWHGFACEGERDTVDEVAALRHAVRMDDAREIAAFAAAEDGTETWRVDLSGFEREEGR